MSFGFATAVRLMSEDDNSIKLSSLLGGSKNSGLSM
jgi:hypothetical protein